MDTREKLITARSGMLALAEELQNISKACKVAKVSRSHYHEIKKAFETHGRDGLAPRQSCRVGMSNQTLPELEAKILEMTERFPIAIPKSTRPRPTVSASDYIRRSAMSS